MGLRGDVHADLDEPLAVLEFVRKHIALLVYLFQSVLRAAVNLELEDIDAVVRPADRVGATYGSLDLRPDVEAQEGEYQIDDGLVVLLALVLKVVRNAGEVGLELLHREIDVLRVHGRVEMRDEAGGRGGLARILVEKPPREAYLHLLVRVAEGVELHAGVVGLDGQIARLVEHREGVVRNLGRDIEVRLRNQRQAVQLGLVYRVAAEALHKIGRRGRIKPIAAETPVRKRIDKTERIIYILRLVAEVIAVVVVFQPANASS